MKVECFSYLVIIEIRSYNFIELTKITLNKIKLKPIIEYTILKTNK